MRANFHNGRYDLGEPLVIRHTLHMKNYTVNSRETTSFLWIEVGSMRYHTESDTFEISAGEGAYLPSGSSYRYELLSDTLICYQATFRVAHFADDVGTPISLCLSPMPIYRHAELLRDTLREAVHPENDFALLSQLYTLLSLAEKELHKDTPSYGILTPAVVFLQNKYTEKISSDALSALCHISPSHFRRLFKEAFGMSAVKYKNKLLCERAAVMLRRSDMTIGEVADALHFADIYTFSQAFRKFYGASPRQYRQLIKD